VSRRDEWLREAARRAAANGGAPTREDEVLRALDGGEPAPLAEAARALASGALIDRDYLAYWVDELGLQAAWRALAV
jgi:hypothetical protein